MKGMSASEMSLARSLGISSVTSTRRPPYSNCITGAGTETARPGCKIRRPAGRGSLRAATSRNTAALRDYKLAFHASLAVAGDRAVEDVLAGLVDLQVHDTGGRLGKSEVDVSVPFWLLVLVLAGSAEV